MCRSEKNISQEDREKIALFCNLHPKQVILAKDVSTIYEAPLAYQQQGLDIQVLRYFGLPHEDIHLDQWEEMVKKIKTTQTTLTIAIVGKYTGLGDAYKSINEAFVHAGVANNVKVLMKWVDARVYSPQNKEAFLTQLHGAQGIFVPGGFGTDGTEGKIAAIEYARVQNIPYFGICLGMQLAVIESARNIANLPDVNSTEFSSACKNPIISLMT